MTEFTNCAGAKPGIESVPRSCPPALGSPKKNATVVAIDAAGPLLVTTAVTSTVSPITGSVSEKVGAAMLSSLVAVTSTGSTATLSVLVLSASA